MLGVDLKRGAKLNPHGSSRMAMRAVPGWWAPPHPVLYHYTTQVGLLGILNKREIWATHTQYLNDHREFRHAIEIFGEELEHLALLGGDLERRKCIEEMRQEVQDELSSTNVCVVSFSEKSDSLSQWRAYAGNAGFAIGLRGEHLAALSVEQHAYLAPCIYDIARQRAVARALLEEVIDQNLSPERLNLQPGGNLSAYLLRFAPLFKHHAFAEEREWRVITRPQSCKSERFDFRAGGSMLIPYYRFRSLTTQILFVCHRSWLAQRPMSGKRQSPQGAYSSSSDCVMSLLRSRKFRIETGRRPPAVRDRSPATGPTILVPQAACWRRRRCSGVWWFRSFFIRSLQLPVNHNERTRLAALKAHKVVSKGYAAA